MSITNTVDFSLNRGYLVKVTPIYPTKAIGVRYEFIITHALEPPISFIYTPENSLTDEQKLQKTEAMLTEVEQNALIYFQRNYEY